MEHKLDFTRARQQEIHSLSEKFFGVNPAGKELGFTNYYMTIDGKPFFGISGECHFTHKTYYSSGYCAPPYDYTMQAIKINRTGTSGETIKLVGTHGTGFINPHMFFFQKQ